MGLTGLCFDQLCQEEVLVYLVYLMMAFLMGRHLFCPVSWPWCGHERWDTERERGTERGGGPGNGGGGEGRTITDVGLEDIREPL